MGEDLGMGDERHGSSPLLQDAHQAAGVIIVAVAEADQTDLFQIYIQSIGIMEHHLRGSTRVPEQLHAL